MTTPPKGERLAKVIARAGICSRRAAEELILQGRIQVNGETITTPATTVTAQDVVMVDDQKLTHGVETKIWLYHKPKGLVTTHKDPQGRPTVFSRLPATLPRVISVGRLDLTTEGLLLLTNDGELARHLEKPQTGWIRRYRVRVFGRMDIRTQKQLADLEQGITLDGITYGGIQVVLESQTGHNSWLVVSLKEGKNREIRKVMEACGLQVNRLIRVAYGPFQLGSLLVGEVKQVNGKVLKEQLGDWKV